MRFKIDFFSCGNASWCFFRRLSQQNFTRRKRSLRSQWRGSGGVLGSILLKTLPVIPANWETEKENEVYKIFLLSDDKRILGLMSLVDIPEEFRIHLNLLEVSKPHQGKDKELDFIAGCLIAFAAELAIKRVYYGFVSLEPKTRLIDQVKRSEEEGHVFIGPENVAQRVVHCPGLCCGAKVREKAGLVGGGISPQSTSSAPPGILPRSPPGRSIRIRL